jgi:cathepsin F
MSIICRSNIYNILIQFCIYRNSQEKKLGGSAQHGITKFADLTQAEFESMYLDSHTSGRMRERNATRIETPRGATSGAVDYTGKQTTAIKDQGSCGSCW